MSDDVLVRVENVSKRFCRSLKRSLWYGLQDLGSEIGGRRHGGGRGLPQSSADVQLRPDEFWAVKDVSFELRRGECLGLIGRNGAGKTTLLKMLNGLIKPDQGEISIRGRVGALISLGAGFNGILTGRENIYINGSVLGLSKDEIDGKISEIIDFAEISDFIDMPVQNYSSGMTVRLGFAVASSMSPDVLILDEVLSVGDIGFVIKCLNRVRRLAADAAVVLVSHNMQTISSFCSRVLLMNHGQIMLDTKTLGEALDSYNKMIEFEKNESGSGEARIYEALLRQGKSIHQGAAVELDLSFEVAETCSAAEVLVYIMDEAMTPVICYPVNGANRELYTFHSGRHQVSLPLGQLDLAGGSYSLTISISCKESKRNLIRSQGLYDFRIFAEKAHWGRIVRPIITQ